MKRNLLIIIVAVVAMAGLAVWYDLTHVFLISSSPANKSQKVAQSDPVTLTFNQSLADDNQSHFSIEPKVHGNITITGRRLTFTPSDPYQPNTSYTVTLAQPTSSTGRVGGDAKISFTAKQIDYQNQTPTQQAASLGQTDALARSNPLVGFLPQQTLHYDLEFTVDADKNVQYQLHLNAILLDPSQQADYQALLKQYKQEAFDFIRSKSVDPTKLPIQFDPPEAKDL